MNKVNKDLIHACRYLFAHTALFSCACICFHCAWSMPLYQGSSMKNGRWGRCLHTSGIFLVGGKIPVLCCLLTWSPFTRTAAYGKCVTLVKKCGDAFTKFCLALLLYKRKPGKMGRLCIQGKGNLTVWCGYFEVFKWSCIPSDFARWMRTSCCAFRTLLLASRWMSLVWHRRMH